MKFSVLLCLASLTSVWANPGDTASSSEPQSLAQVIAQYSQANIDMTQYCPAAFFDYLTKLNKAVHDFRAESPNNRMLYEAFRTRATRHFLLGHVLAKAITDRQDPELLKNFHLEFTDEKLHEPVQVDGPATPIQEFLEFEEEAEGLEAIAVQSLRRAMADVDRAKKARVKAEKWRIKAHSEIVRHNQRLAKKRKQPECDEC